MLPLWVWRLCSFPVPPHVSVGEPQFFIQATQKMHGLQKSSSFTGHWVQAAVSYWHGGVLGASKRALETFPRAFVEKCLEITCSGLARLRADRGRTLTCKATTETELYIRMGVNIQVNARAQKTGALNGSTFDSILSFFAFRSILNIQAPVSAGCLIFKRC